MSLQLRLYKFVCATAHGPGIVTVMLVARGTRRRISSRCHSFRSEGKGASPDMKVISQRYGLNLLRAILSMPRLAVTHRQ